MRIYLALALALTGCVDNGFSGDGGGGGGGGGSGGGGGGGGGYTPPSHDCPGSSLCSPSGPSAGLTFAGAQPLMGQWPTPAFVETHNHILSGGTDDIQLQIGNGESFLATYTTMTTPPLVVESTDRNVVHLSESVGTGELQIINPTDNLFYDTYRYASSSLATTTPLSEFEIVTSPDWFSLGASAFAFWTRNLDVVLAYQGPNGNRLVDTSLVLASDQATQERWDQLSFTNATAGVHVVHLTTGGGATATAQIRVVDQADFLAALVNQAGFVCLGAFSQGAFISHAPISFTVNGVAATTDTGLGPNCIEAVNGDTVIATVPGATVTLTAGTDMPTHSRAEIDQRIAELRAARAALQ